jgi:hypothetical protein
MHETNVGDLFGFAMVMSLAALGICIAATGVIRLAQAVFSRHHANARLAQVRAVRVPTSLGRY